MRADDDDGDTAGGHGDESDDAVTVEPGDSAGADPHLREAGATEVGCHQEGHYDAGMVIAVE